MPLLPSKRTGGFKLVIGKKTDYGYHIAALIITVCLLTVVACGILYASNAVTRLFKPPATGEGNMVQFNLDRAQKNQKLALPTPSLTPTPSALPPTSSPEILSATTTPPVPTVSP